MIRALSRLLLVGAVFAAAACDEEMIGLDQGTASTLDVQAYVDADGNGSFDSGSDTPIASATIELTGGPGGSVQLSEATGSDGMASFTGLAPGSYQVALSGDVPSGAVLSTAAHVTVVAPFRGESLSAEFRYSLEPGSISGRLFRDDNESGSFEPEEDTPAAGVTLTLFGGAFATGDPVAQAVTEADGAFVFQGLRPGEYTMTVDAPPSVTIVGGTEQRVTVGADVTAQFSVIFEGSFLISVAEARAASPGDPVTVEGTVTWAPSFDSRTAFIQDGSAGIVIFDSDGLGALVEGASELTEGQVVRVTGERDEFFSEVQISGITSLQVVETGGVPDPRLVTAGEINAGQFQAELVTNQGVVESVDVRSFGNQLVTLRGSSGEVFTVWADSRTGVEADTWTEGQTYGVTGVLGIDTREDLPYRIEVRSPDDVQAGGSTISVAEARTMLGESVVVQGVVTWVSPDDRVIFFQDETGGMSTFDFDLPPLSRGDLVTLRGTVGAFQGEVQLSPVSDVQILGNVSVPPPAGVTAAQLNGGARQGELVVATGTVQAVEVLDSFGNQRVTLTDPAGTDFALRVDSRTGIDADFWTVDETVRVTGVVGNDNRDTPAPRIEPRGPEDVQKMVTAGVVSVAEARSMSGEVVTVEGVVTRNPSFAPTAFIQDETGGIALFSFSLVGGLTPGDLVRATGEVSAFNGELQIGLDDVEVLDQVAVPDPLPVTGGQINAGLFQGQLVEVQGTVIQVEVVNQFGTQEVLVRDDQGTVFLAFVDNRSGLTADDWTVDQTVTIVGILGFFDGNDPGAQLEVMEAADVTFGG